jgi:hypothetical protein
MSNPFNLLQPWKAGDTRELSGGALKKANLEGKFDSNAPVYLLDGQRWKVLGKVNLPSGDSVCTLVGVNE